MTIIKYPCFVDVDKIESDEQLSGFRFYIKIPFKNSSLKKKLCVIMKNPSKADNQQCDNTISKVCNAANHNGYGEVIILNLFPFRSTNPKNLIDFYESDEFDKLMEKNYGIIKSYSDCDIVFAWGTNTIPKNKKNTCIYDSAIDNVINIFSKSDRILIAGHNSSNPKYYLHGLRWKNTSELLKLK